MKAYALLLTTLLSGCITYPLCPAGRIGTGMTCKAPVISKEATRAQIAQVQAAHKLELEQFDAKRDKWKKQYCKKSPGVQLCTGKYYEDAYIDVYVINTVIIEK